MTLPEEGRDYGTLNSKYYREPLRIPGSFVPKHTLSFRAIRKWKLVELGALSSLPDSQGRWWWVNNWATSQLLGSLGPGIPPQLMWRLIQGRVAEMFGSLSEEFMFFEDIDGSEGWESREITIPLDMI